ncbi:MAG TPA: hypothetical protein VG603_00435 [Chitinophagales bacterium]|nr:hypothetical protein [Chitinophagales bacterium]
MANSNYNITDGINTNIRRAIQVAIDKGNRDTYYALYAFGRRVIQLSIQKHSLADFQQYIFLSSLSYVHSYRLAQQKKELQDFHVQLAEYSALSLKEIIWMDLGFFEKSKKFERAELNAFYYWAYYGFSDFLVNVITNQDFKLFSYALDEFEQISYKSNSELRFQLQQLKRDEGNKEAIQSL